MALELYLDFINLFINILRIFWTQRLIERAGEPAFFCWKTCDILKKIDRKENLHMKRPFISREKLKQIMGTYPTPFHLYDEAGIRQTARALHQAFSWNPGFKEYFAIKATPNPAILKSSKRKAVAWTVPVM